jgi:hypothetical protein
LAIAHKPIINGKANALNNKPKPNWVMNSGKMGSGVSDNKSAVPNRTNAQSSNNRAMRIIKGADRIFK